MEQIDKIKYSMITTFQPDSFLHLICTPNQPVNEQWKKKKKAHRGRCGPSAELCELEPFFSHDATYAEKLNLISGSLWFNHALPQL